MSASETAFHLAPHIFKSYDVRGLYPEELNPAGLACIVRAFAEHTTARRLVVARDVRASGPVLAAAAIAALRALDIECLDIGTVSTDTFYYAVAAFDCDGGFTISASHNPGNWNGLNFCRRGAEPVSLSSGLEQVRARALELAGQRWRPGPPRAAHRTVDVLDDYADYVLSFIEPSLLRPSRIVAHGNCGLQAEMLEHIVRRGHLPLEIHPIYGVPDGNFPVPGGVPNPLLPENQGEFLAAVRQTGADLGVAWDADGDRCFFADETGYFISGYFATAILARSVLTRHPGATVVIDPRNIWATQETIARLGGRTVLSRAGMTIIPQAMREHGAEFAGEMSAHFYFRRNHFRDNGMIPLLLLLELLGRENCRLSDLVRPLREHYFTSGELNFRPADAAALVRQAASIFGDGQQDHIDGLSVAYPDWRFNLRSSNTEPLLRLNVEARSQSSLDAGLRRLLSLLGSPVGAGH